MTNENRELPEGLVEELEDALTGVFGHSHAIARLALSVIAPHYEKQIAELKAQIPQWLPISEYSFIKYGDEVLGLIPFSGGEEVHEIRLSKSKKYPYWTAYIFSLGDRLQPTYFMPKPKPPAE